MEEEFFSFPVADAISILTKKHPFPSLQPFLNNNNIGRSFQKNDVILELCKLLVEPQYTRIIARTCRPILLNLIAEIIHNGILQIEKRDKIIIALSYLIYYCPNASGLIYQHLKKSPSIFDSIISRKSTKTYDEFPLEQILSIVQTSHRLLRFPNFRDGVLKNLNWNWNILYDLLNYSNDEVKWNAAKCICLLGNHSFEEYNNIIQSIVFPPNEKQFLRNLIEDDTIENSLLLMGTSPNNHKSKNLLIKGSDLHFCIADVCGVLLLRKQVQHDETHHSHQTDITPISKLFTKLTPTPTTLKNMRALAFAVCQGNPILLEGVTGAGKTSLIDELAALTNNQDIIKMHLGDQSDAKVLLGTYICTEVPGEFKWQPGALTQAVKEGKWILIEDIDIASVDVISILLPLLENNKLYIPGRGEEITAASGFQLFATETLIGSSSSSKSNSHLLNKFWTKVLINPLSYEELTEVISTHFPSLSPITHSFISTFRSLKNSQLLNQMYGTKSLSSRDLFKWCKRVELTCRNVPNLDQFVPDSVKDLIFVSAIDCFCSTLPKLDQRIEVLKQIAYEWTIPPDKIKYYLEMYKPEVNETPDAITVGRVTISKIPKKGPVDLNRSTSRFAHTITSLQLMERVASCILLGEPVLLVGETGTGKTTTIQHLADKLGQKLIVQNLSQQTDSTDMLGGFKPIELRLLCIPLKRQFEKLFPKTFSKSSNKSYIDTVLQAYVNQDWTKFIKYLIGTVKKVDNMILQSEESNKPMHPKLRLRWKAFGDLITKFEFQQNQLKNNFAFSFVEGALVRAVRFGHWVLLDEINLATTETLESLSGLLEGGGIYLTERGDIKAVERHPNFRIFACMNPPTDVGKKDLPPGLRNRFSEYFVDELLSVHDLRIVVLAYLKDISPNPPVDDIVNFYLAAKKEAHSNLSDGANQKPHYSLRTLCRALQYIRETTSHFGFMRALFEGLSVSFLTQLNRKSYPLMERLISQHILKKTPKSQLLSQLPRRPGDNFIQFEHYWIETGDHKSSSKTSEYILTPSIKAHLNNLARVVLYRKYPVLLQGPTSSGKTSMVQYLANITGHRFVRINNHEYTDIQEYLGSYTSDQSGNLVFQEGILVEAVRKGYWVVLDELNLAPSEVLEALNRLLDDNRELFIPETQQIVKPHPHFMLFATQNPPGMYGGRKALSRAFRNRFLEYHFDEIPDDELETILQKRCAIPPSYCTKLVSVMKDLQRQRQGSNVFAGKQGFITLRDLFRWADRKAQGYEALAADGYMLLAERLRKPDEKLVIQKSLEKRLKVKLDMEKVYEEVSKNIIEPIQELFDNNQIPRELRIVWTKSAKRLLVLVAKCLEFQEPILLVGETGCGKTTVCQLYSYLQNRKLHAINCHQNSETADFLGSLRPNRHKDQVGVKINSSIDELRQVCTLDTTDLGDSSKPVKDRISSFETWYYNQSIALNESESAQQLYPIIQEILNNIQSYKSLFIWEDGPLVEAMKRGEFLLIDEISLAEDSVLERLNSVLERERLLTLAEKGGGKDIEELVAHTDFRVMATMNPGGDFGKKELSPALRNRFTEIWVPTVAHRDERLLILQQKLDLSLREDFGKLIIDFIEWFSSYYQHKRIISLRDILSWANFMNITHEKGIVNPYDSYIHGCCLVLLDGLSITIGLSEKKYKTDRKLALDQLVQFLSSVPKALIPSLKDSEFEVESLDNSHPQHFGISNFFIEKGKKDIPSNLHYTLHAPTTKTNILRILRALQIPKPVLLEGSPGVGKTSMILALAAASGHNVVRINLSEQTDMMDLLGSDLPVEGDVGRFQWCDGVFLTALKKGDWVLLDELNLASQSVLEGLNSCLDHRGTVFIPEIGLEFKCPSSFRVFACQNPTQQGGGRKGLPKSFLNRFTTVYVEKFTYDDLLYICSTMYSDIDSSLLTKMITFNMRLYDDSMVHMKFARKGRPWEFNLRDIFRWCDLLRFYTPKDLLFTGNIPHLRRYLSTYIDTVYLQRLRTTEDREYVKKIFKEIFEEDFDLNIYPYYQISKDFIQVGGVRLERSKLRSSLPDKQLQLLHSQLNALENLMRCVELNWMSIILGPAASGKTCLVQLLAKLSGRDLKQFWMNSSVDTTELLGGFEQVDLTRRKQTILTCFENLLSDITHSSITSSFVHKVENCFAFSDIQNLNNRWNNIRGAFLDISAVGIKEINLIAELLQYIDNNKDKIVNESTLHSIQTLHHLIKEYQTIQEHSITGCFEWIDGTLINALENGDWLLIDNVNFCNPTVLDRLNPLLEQGGSLLINERGLIGGEVKIVKPHKDFRIFLTMDPNNGEISRAMRNRGIEINLFPIAYDEISKRDLTIILNSIGVPGAEIPSSMIDFHFSVASKLYQSVETPPSPRELSQWGSLTIELLRQGFDVKTAFYDGMEQIYLRKLKSKTVKENIISSYNQNFQITSETILNSQLRAPTLWPYLITGSLYLYDAKFATILRQISVPYHIMLENSAKSIDFRIDSGDKTISQFLEKNQIPLSTYPVHLLCSTFSQNHSNIKTKHNDTLLPLYTYSVLSFFESVSLDSLPGLIHIYNSFIKPLEKLANREVTIFSQVLEMIQDNQVTKNLSTLYESIFSLLKINNFNDQPIILSVNEPLFHHIQMTLSYDDEKLSTVLTSAVNAYQLFLRMIVRYIEEIYEMENIGTEPTLIQQSYQLSKGKLRFEIQNVLVETIFPFISELDTSISLLLKSSIAQNSLFNEANFSEVIKFLLYRNELWNLFNQPTISPDSFITLWNMITKLFTHISETSLNTNLNVPKFNEIENLISAHKLYSKSNTYWRFGPRPRLLKFVKDEFFQITSLLSQLNDAISVRGFNLKPQLQKKFFSQEQFYLIIESLSTLEWIDWNYNTLENSSTLVENIIKVKDLLQQNIAAIIDDEEKSKGDQLFSIDLYDTQPNYQKIWISNSRELLSIINDYTCTQLEFSLIANLQHLLLISAITSQYPDDHGENLQKLVTHYLEFVLKTTRSPSELVPLKHISWIINSMDNTQDESAIVPNKPKITNDEYINGLMCLFPHALYHFHTHIWKNDYHRVLEFIYSTYTPRTEGDYIGYSFDSFVGSNNLFDSSLSTFAFFMNSNVSSAPLELRDEKISQLTDLKSNLQNIHLLDEYKSDFQAMVTSFLQVLFAFLSSYSLENQSIKNHIMELLVIQTELLNFSTSKRKEAMGPYFCNLYNIVYQYIEDPLFVELKQSYVTPILKSLEEYSGLLDYSIEYLFGINDDITKLRANLWIKLGVLQYQLLTPETNIDPTSKNYYKKLIKEKLRAEIEKEVQFRKVNAVIFSQSPIIDQLNTFKNEFDVEIENLAEKITPRPSPPQFESFFAEIQRFQEHFFSIDKIEKLHLSLLNFSVNDKSTGQQEATFQGKSQEFIALLLQRYPDYSDFTIPIINSIYAVKFGLRILRSHYAKIEQHLQSNSNQLVAQTVKKSKIIVSKAVLELAKTPFVSFDQTDTISKLQFLLNEETLISIHELIPRHAINDTFSTYLKSVLYKTFNYIRFAKRISNSAQVNILNRVFIVFVKTWEKMVEEEKEKARLEDEKFKWKERSHDVETEEEEEEREFKLLFPDYSEQFLDLIPNDDSFVDDEYDEFVPEVKIEDILLDSRPTIGDDEIYFLYHIHQYLFNSSLTSNEIISEEQREEFILSYKAAASLYQYGVRVSDRYIDKEILSGHFLASKIQLDSLNSSPDLENVAQFMRLTKSKTYNIYKDENIAEAQLLLAPLQSLKLTIFQLLKQWPEHPILQQICKIINRLLEFPVNSPLMKFITGLEILMKNTTEWESYACSAVSLKEHLEVIAKLIARWRKIELASWPQILSTKQEIFERKASKLWFNLYQAVLSGYSQDSGEDLTILVSTLTDFVQSSNIGEFETRMKLLKAFANQVIEEQKLNFASQNGNIISSIIVNIYNYFNQFWPAYIEKFKFERNRIQKDITDFVKITKWEKLEYYMLKDIADKSHRNLNKFAKNFEKVLKLPMAQFFTQPDQNITDRTPDINTKEVIKTIKKTARSRKQQPIVAVEVKKSAQYTTDFISLVPQSLYHIFAIPQVKNQKSSYHHHKLFKLRNTVEKLYKTHLFSVNAEEFRKELFFTLDDIAVNIIERSTELQNEKDVNQKKLAVTDLIHTFKSVGISHYSSSLHPAQKDIKCLLKLDTLTFEQKLFSFEIPNNFIDNSPLFSDLLKKCENYYYISIGKLQKQRELLASPPNRDLSMREANLIGNYAENLFSCVIKQRANLSQISNSYSLLNDIRTVLNTIDVPKIQTVKSVPIFDSNDFESVVPPQKDLIERIMNLDKIIPEITQTISQLKLLVSSHEISKWSKYQENIRDIQSKYQLLISTLPFIFNYQIYNSNDTISSATTVSNSQRNIIEEIYISLSSLCNTIYHDIESTTSSNGNANDFTLYSNILSYFNSLNNSLEAIKFEKTKYKNITTKKAQKIKPIIKKTTSNFVESLESSVTNILLSIQTLINSLPKPKEKEKVEKNGENGEEDNEEEEEELESVNAKEVQASLDLSLKVISNPDLTTKLLSILEHVQSISNQCNRNFKIEKNILQAYQSFLLQLEPLIAQYQLIYQRVLSYYIIWHKGHCKLLYVTSGLLTNLLINGFCKAEEGAKEGKMEDDISGTGMGSGEGKKDVSKEIEDEEQLQKPERDEPLDNKPPEEEENGLETEQDFEAGLSDVKDQEKEDKNSDDEEEEEEEDDFEKKMGDVDREKEEILDEKLWDENEDNKDEMDENEGSNIDSNVVEDELMAKNDDQDEKDPQKDREDKNENQNKEEDQPNEGEDEEKEEEEGDDEEGDDEEGDELEGEMVDIQDDEERKKFDELQEEEEFELPDDMNLDDGENAEEEGDQPPVEEEEEEEDKTDSEGEMGDEDPDDATPDENEQDENENNQKETPMDVDPDNNDENDSEKELDDPLNKDSTNNPTDPDQYEQNVGVHDITGNTPINNDPLSNQNDKTNDMEEDHQSKNDQPSSDLFKESNKQEDNQFQSENNNEKEKEEKQNSKQRVDPNPYRNLGEATQEWQRRAKIIQEQDQQQNDKQNDSNQSNVDENTEFKFEENQQPNASNQSMQTLAPATEEQQKKAKEQGLQFADNEEEDEEKSKEEEEEEINDGERSDMKLREIEQPLSQAKKDANEETKPKADQQDTEMKDDIKNEEDKEENEEDSQEKEEDKSKFADGNILRSLDDETLDDEDDEEEELIIPLSHEEQQKLREQLRELSSTNDQRNIDEVTHEKWAKFEELTASGAQELCEQLRLILEPTLATKLRGDYRTGKRINMKKVVPYIASQFRKDKIWLRRTKPNKRHYQIMIAIDDSESMTLNQSGQLACESLTMISKALSKLEVGELSIVKFGDFVNILHPFDRPFTDEDGPRVLSEFTFAQKNTNVRDLLTSTIAILENARSSSTSSENIQLVFIISDGRLSNQKGLGQWIREAESKNMLIVFLVIDSPTAKDSILEVESISFSGKNVIRTLYIDDFPFPYYIIVRDLNNLPDILADALRQWFELLQHKTS